VAHLVEQLSARRRGLGVLSAARIGDTTAAPFAVASQVLRDLPPHTSSTGGDPVLDDPTRINFGNAGCPVGAVRGWAVEQLRRSRQTPATSAGVRGAECLRSRCAAEAAPRAWMRTKRMLRPSSKDQLYLTWIDHNILCLRAWSDMRLHDFLPRVLVDMKGSE
jgi:hypothetical protein